MASSYGPDVLAAVKPGRVNTDKQGQRYILETGSGRRISHAFKIPVTTAKEYTTKKGETKIKYAHKLVGAFATLGALLRWVLTNMPTHFDEIYTAVCSYYQQAKIEPSPFTEEQLKENPALDADQQELERHIPGVISADEVKKRKAKGEADGSEKPKKPKKKVVPPVLVNAGLTLVLPKKTNPTVELDGKTFVKQLEQMRKRGGGSDPVSVWRKPGVVFLFAANQNDPEIAAKLKANPWSGSPHLKGAFIVQSTKKLKLRFSSGENSAEEEVEDVADEQ